jgi:hypothetical protein
VYGRVVQPGLLTIAAGCGFPAPVVMLPSLLPRRGNILLDFVFSPGPADWGTMEQDERKTVLRCMGLWWPKTVALKKGNIDCYSLLIHSSSSLGKVTNSAKFSIAYLQVVVEEVIRDDRLSAFF